MRKLRGAGSPISLLSFGSTLRADAKDRGGISGGGPNMSFPLSSLHLASDRSFLILLSDPFSSVPLNSRCFATSGTLVGFLGEILSSVPKDIWLIPLAVCCQWNRKNYKEKIQVWLFHCSTDTGMVAIPTPLGFLYLYTQKYDFIPSKFFELTFASSPSLHLLCQWMLISMKWLWLKHKKIVCIPAQYGQMFGRWNYHQIYQVLDYHFLRQPQIFCFQSSPSFYILNKVSWKQQTIFIPIRATCHWFL